MALDAVSTRAMASTVTRTWPATVLAPGLRLLVGFAVFAIAFRSPGLLFSDLNWDEGLYRLIADSLVRGHAPYVEFWDRKPVGIFMILAAVQEILGPSILATRIATSLIIALGAAFLSGIGRALFPSRPSAGLLGGILYVVFSVRFGGAGTNTELVFMPLNIVGLWLLLRAGTSGDRHNLMFALAAGLAMGAAIQVKYNAVFDIAAFALIFLLLRLDGLNLAALARLLPLGFSATLGVVLPTAAVMVWYAAVGHWDDWFGANILANAKLVGETAPRFGFGELPGFLWDADLLVFGAAVALASAAILTDPHERRSLFALLIWLVGDCLALLFLRRFADHMILQTLPVLSLLTGFAAALLWDISPAHRRAGRAALVAAAIAYVAWGGRTIARPFDAAVEVLRMREVAGLPGWGDPAAVAAAAIRPRLHPGDEIYVVSPMLGIYQATGTLPPTRFPFVGHLWEGYAHVGTDEIARILGRRPAFIVVEDRWLPGTQPTGLPEESAPVLAMLHDALAHDYVLDLHCGAFISRGGGGIGPPHYVTRGVTVFRLRDPDGARSAN